MWNYRIVKDQKKKIYGLHEVYYGEKGELSWTKNSMIGYFETKKELIETLGMMLKDARKHTTLIIN